MVAHTEKDVWKPVTTRIKIIKKNNEQTNKKLKLKLQTIHSPFKKSKKT